MILHNKEIYPKICLDILSYMEEKWPSHLTYHNLNHIIDVANTCEGYIAHYCIEKEQADLLRIATISHDIGYLVSPKNHEEQGILQLAPFIEKILNKYQIEIVNNLIRATKIPQKPNSLLEEILADADLDYLGRADYDILSEGLYLEFLHYNLVINRSDWLSAQITFLENHSYHTAFARTNRTKRKLKKLEELKLQKKNSI